MGIVDKIGKGLKKVGEKLKVAAKNAEERRKSATSTDDFQQFAEGIKNLNENLLGEGGSKNEKTRSSIRDDERWYYPGKEPEPDIIEEIVVVKRAPPKKTKRRIIYVEEEPKRPSRPSYNPPPISYPIPRGFTDEFEEISGVPEKRSMRGFTPIKRPPRDEEPDHTYDLLYGSR